MDPEHGFIIDGFPTLELAIEFARRWTRDSLESFRKPNQSKKELRKMWYMFGETAIVLDSDYSANSELDFFIDHPATLEERDWQSVKKKAGIQ
ncbi:MAG: hypothetical protein ACUVXA_13085 [Candidatus Jordarchaeum sp.]|uniref:hypothetical protein n=1 Tax=Candidatus Jordarchaeum sp. TaxID=2823881 RepID=UPI00404B23E1